MTGWAILQGPTTAKDARFAVLHGNQENLGACVGNTTSTCAYQPTEVIHKARPESDWTVTQFIFRGLNSKEALKLRIDNGKGVEDFRDFKLLAPEKTLKFAVVSCMDDTFSEIQGPMWKSVLGKKPDVFFFIGDNVYGDKHLPPKEAATPTVLWHRYVDTRQTLEVFRSKNLIPTFAVWDDHDFGLNDGNGTYKYKNESRDIFLSFFPMQEGFGLKRGPGVSSAITLAGQDFIFLDDRYFRSKETHWGNEQKEWLFKRLRENRNPVWLINGDQFFGGYHTFESFEGNHPVEFKAFRNRLRDIHKPLNFISGDRHLAEVMKIEPGQIGRETYELTSSGIHAKVFPDAFERHKNPRQVAGVAGEYNYMIVDSAVLNGELKVNLTAYGKTKKHFEFAFAEK